MGNKQELLTELEQLVLLKGYRRAKTDFIFFLREFVFTLDEHDKTAPVKRFPSKDYLDELGLLFVNEDRVLVEKSRQMMVTWLVCAFALWYTMFYDGRRTFIQSKKEKDADETLNRIKLIYDNLPELFKELHPTQSAYCRLEWGKQKSVIQAVPQGADVLRQYTASLIVSDEMAFQDKSEEAYIGSRPTLIGGGKFIGISSPNFKEFFYLLKSDLTG